MSMIKELNLQRIDYEEMLINYFTILLISLHRIALQKVHVKNEPSEHERYGTGCTVLSDAL